jgi:ADP-ribose pyrophosphatase
MTDTRHEGRWLRFCERAFKDAHGFSKSWEYVTRKKTTGAVCIVALLPGPEPRIVLVEQYRPPLDARILEFPAGLIEPGGEPSETALRELAEETGCLGRVLEVGPAVYNSPGLTDENVYAVTVEVTGRAEVRHEADEDIRVVELPLHRLRAALEEQARGGTQVDSKLWYYAVGLDAADRG